MSFGVLQGPLFSLPYGPRIPLFVLLSPDVLFLHPRALHLLFCPRDNTSFSPSCSEKDLPSCFHQGALRSWGTPAAPAVPEEAAGQGLLFLIGFSCGLGPDCNSLSANRGSATRVAGGAAAVVLPGVAVLGLSGTKAAAAEKVSGAVCFLNSRSPRHHDMNGGCCWGCAGLGRNLLRRARCGLGQERRSLVCRAA